jgi:hypothetical protein
VAVGTVPSGTVYGSAELEPSRGLFYSLDVETLGFSTSGVSASSVTDRA